MSEISGRFGSHPSAGGDDGADLQPDAAGGRWMRRHIAGGVLIATTVADGGFRGSTVSACLAASLDPLLLLLSIERDTQMEDWLLEAGRYAVSIVPWREKFLADQFAGLTPLASPTFADIEHDIGPTGCPIIRRSIGWADCIVDSSFITGDHRNFVGAVQALGRGALAEDDPLIYYAGRFHRQR